MHTLTSAHHLSAWRHLAQRPALLATLAMLGAGASSTSMAMNLQDVYIAAERNDASIRAARAGSDATKERLPQAKAQLGPNVSLSATRNFNDLTTRSQSMGQPVKYANEYYSGNQSISIRQPLYRPYQMALLRQAQAAVDDAEAILEHDEQSLVVRVAEAYFDALLAEDQVQLITSQKASYLAQLDAADKSFAAGSGTKTDIHEAQARVDMAAAQELEARQHVQWAQRRLETLIGQPLQPLAHLNSAQFAPSAPLPADVSEWIALAEAHSPKLRALQAQIEQARQEVEKAKSGHKPTLDAIAQWSRSSSDSVTSINTRYNQQAIGLQLNVPLYSGGHVSSTVRQAAASYEQTRHQLEAMRLELGVQVHQEFRGVTEGILKVKALEQAVHSAEQSLESNQKSFKAGVRTTLDVLNAEQQKTTALRDLAQARYMLVLAQLRLHSLAGHDRWRTIEQANAVLVAR